MSKKLKVLTKEQIKTIWDMQKELDEDIRKNNNISPDTDLSLEKYIALKTEFFELINEIEAFKFWKKNKGKEHIIEEASDMLHFIFSLAIDADEYIEMQEDLFKDINVFDLEINEITGIIDMNISDIVIDCSYEKLFLIIAELLILLNLCGFDADDLYNAYINKNKVNHERQKNNY